ncbi:hypothetical protein CHS0354_023649 [Potamilus streckersoni]|uniref:Uncharacterized protein n=1 Tax=Potamilus streckersoni TaxID=2493646 RepID=A0AAE0SYC4_9BIVA|nr:hypothetical protein CHS0354_023649 [Potamilus streckersoni]
MEEIIKQNDSPSRPKGNKFRPTHIPRMDMKRRHKQQRATTATTTNPLASHTTKLALTTQTTSHNNNGKKPQGCQTPINRPIQLHAPERGTNIANDQLKLNQSTKSPDNSTTLK